MALTETQDYVCYDSGMMMNSKQPMKNVDVCLVSTKDYVFYVPKKSVGMFVVLNTIKTHQYFEGVSIEQGVRNLIEKSESVEELHKSMIALLEDDDKYVHKIADKKSFKFKGFFGKHTVRMSTGGTNWSSVMANGKGNSKAFREFHGQ
ncbi:MAG: hypothetical protein P8P74_00645 [Crocinitomicaceae bacterium]|nr:hypothetical protein [Crocinitomicaceae bacterium]